MGLMIGASVLTVIEVSEFIIQTLHSVCRKAGRRRNVTSNKKTIIVEPTDKAGITNTMDWKGESIFNNKD